jgi:hypothetical protein
MVMLPFHSGTKHWESQEESSKLNWEKWLNENQFGIYFHTTSKAPHQSLVHVGPTWDPIDVGMRTSRVNGKRVLTGSYQPTKSNKPVHCSSQSWQSSGATTTPFCVSEFIRPTVKNCIQTKLSPSSWMMLPKSMFLSKRKEENTIKGTRLIWPHAKQLGTERRQ